MAPTKPSSKGGKSSGKGAPKSSKGSSSAKKAPGKQPEGISKRKQKSLSLAKPGGAQKTKSISNVAGKKKKRVYAEHELDIPKLNSIVPAGVAKPKGQKKGKVFVDDAASIQTIMAMVNAEKEGHIESKIQKARQWEEVREAKRKEAEERSKEKKDKFEERKQGLKKGKKGGKGKLDDVAAIQEMADADGPKAAKKQGKKRVSFG